MHWPARIGKRVRDGMLGALGVAAIGAAAFFVFCEPPVRPIRLRLTAGQDGGTRHRIAQVLRGEAARRAVAIEFHATAGSETALQAVNSGRVDVALVQGGLDMSDHPGLRQAAVLHIEPLHLLEKAEIDRVAARNLAGLRGTVVNVGERGSGTYLLATEVMAFSGLRAGIDYTATNNSPFSHALEPPLDVKLLESPPELPWHDGTIDYVRRNSPVIVGDVIDLIEKELSIIAVLFGILEIMTAQGRKTTVSPPYVLTARRHE